MPRHSIHPESRGTCSWSRDHDAVSIHAPRGHDGSEAAVNAWRTGSNASKRLAERAT